MAGIAGTVLLGAVFDGLFSKANQVIDKATYSGLLLERTAGEEVRRAIENAHVVYIDSLDKTMAQVDRTAQGIIQNLNNLVDDSLATLHINAVDLSKRAQQIANSLPMHDSTPQLTIVSPTMIYRSLDDVSSIYFRLAGNFFHAAQANYTPTLTFNGQATNLVRNTVQDLMFEVPIRTIFSRDELENAKSKIFKKGEVKIPWPNGLLGARREAVFQVLIGALPSTPGKLSLDYDEPNTLIQENKGGYRLDSRSGNLVDGPNNDGGLDYKGQDTDKKRTFERKVTLGWTLVPHSSEVNVSRDLGASQRNGHIYPVEHQDHVSCYAETWRNWGGEAGFLEFEIKFREQKTVMVPKHKDIPLAWNQTIAENLPNGWRLTYTPFDSPHAHTIAAAADLPYLRVVHVGGSSYHLITADPNQLQEI